MSCSTSSNVIIKQSTEVVNVSMDFTALLDDGVTITDADSSVSPNDVVVSGINIVNGTDPKNHQVYFTISGGTDGVNYSVMITVETSDNQVLVGEGPLKVRNS